MAIQKSPEPWFRYKAFEKMNEVRSIIAKKINCKTDNLFLVENATDAFNCIMKSFDWKEGDVLLVPTFAYTSINRVSKWLEKHKGVKV